MSKRLGKKDVIFIFTVFILVAVIALWITFSGRNQGGTVTITIDGDIFTVVPLNKDCEIEITDDSGQVTNYLVIKDGIADVTDATCPDKLCVNQKAIRYNHESIICLPNKVVVTISSDESDDIDVIAQ